MSVRWRGTWSPSRSPLPPRTSRAWAQTALALRALCILAMDAIGPVSRPCIWSSATRPAPPPRTGWSGVDLGVGERADLSPQAPLLAREPVLELVEVGTQRMGEVVRHRAPRALR